MTPFGALALAAVLAARARAATLEVHGTLGDAAGTTERGSYLLRFRIFDLKADGAEAWSESLYAGVAAGEFHASLGERLPIPERLLAEGYRVAVEAPAVLGWKPAITSALTPLAPREQETLTEARRLKESIAAEETPPPPARASSPSPGSGPPRRRKPRVEPAPPEPASPQASNPRETARLMERLEALERKLAPSPGPAGPGEHFRAPEPAAPRVYKAQAGDTLQTVAAKVWGDPTRWVELYNANAERVQRGGYVEAGQILIVPAR